MTSEIFCEEIMEFINGTTGIPPRTNCSILSSTPSATFSSTPSVSLPASTAATLSSTSSSSTVEPPTNSSTLSSTPFATPPVSTAAILPSVLLTPHNIFFFSFLFFSCPFIFYYR